jgi:hypothetical protein
MRWEWIAERKWQEAQASGALDGLAGTGRPLRLDDDSNVPAEWRAAFHLLRRAGWAPDWAEAARQAQTSVDVAGQDLRRALDDDPERARAGWQRALDRFGDEVREANRWIDLANLKAPHPSLQRPRWNAARLAEGIIGKKQDETPDGTQRPS